MKVRRQQEDREILRVYWIGNSMHVYDAYD